MAVSSVSEGGADDPLNRLRERIRSAQSPGRPSAVQAGSDDPLEGLGELIERARDLDSDQLSDAPEPLASLYDQIERARALKPAESIEETGDDPIDTIRSWIGQEVSDIGRRGEPRLVGTSSASRPLPDGGSVEAVLGRELLQMIGEEPLAPAAREQAARLLAEALERPTTERVRRVLRVILRG